MKGRESGFPGFSASLSLPPTIKSWWMLLRAGHEFRNAAIAAVLTALSRLKAEFPSLVEDYARHAFTQGQRVRVLPSDAVFEYGGVWTEFPGYFKLQLIGAETEAFEASRLRMFCVLNPPTGFDRGARAPPCWVNAQAARWTDCSISVPAETTASFATSSCVTCRGYSSRAQSIQLPSHLPAHKHLNRCHSSFRGDRSILTGFFTQMIPTDRR